MHVHNYSYEKVTARIEREKMWALLRVVGGKELPEVVRAIEAVFLDAAMHHDDKACVDLLPYLLHAIDDVQLVPLLTVGEHDRLKYPSHISAKCERKVQAARALYTSDILLRMPSAGSVPVQRRTGHDGSSQITNEPVATLVEIKKLLLLEIARNWRVAESEEEADLAIDFLLNKWRVTFSEDVAAVREAIKTVTTAGFSQMRLLRAYCKCEIPTAQYSYQDGIKDALAVGLVKTTFPSSFHTYLRTIEPIAECEPEVFEAVRKYGMVLAARAKDLAQLRQDQHMFSHSKDYVPGNLTFVYVGLEYVVATLLVNVKYRFDENDGHAWFEKTKQRILDWQQMHPIKVVLRLVVDSEYQKGIFQREQTLG